MSDLILASSSPRRRELLASLGVQFEISVPEIDETLLPNEEAVAYVQRLARGKGKAVMAKYIHRDAVVIAADTTVYFNGCILGKPDSPKHAKEIIMNMSGKTHVVYTGLFVGHTVNKKNSVCTCVATEVDFHPLTEREVEQYVATGDPMDKAGAYGIQGEGGKMVKNIRGSYTNVMGLPLEDVKSILAQQFDFKF